MKIGMLATAHSPVGNDPAEAYGDWLELALEAERLGFWSVWTTQHHFGTERDFRPFGVDEEQWPTVDYDMVVDALSWLLYVAAKTTRIRLGTAVSVPLWDNPLLLAERAAMLDVLSGGRLEMGVARGGGFRELETFEVPRDDDASRRKFSEAIEVLRRAWEDVPFSFDGEFYKYPELIMVPRPKRQPIPLWIGASTVGTARLAARIGLPYATTTWPLVALEKHVEKREAYLETANEVGLDTSGFAIPHYLFMYCGESDEEARATAGHYLREYQYILEGHYQHVARRVQLSHHVGAEVPVANAAPGAGRQYFGTDLSALANTEQVTENTLATQPIGSAATVLERLNVYKEKLDLNYLVVNLGWGGMPVEQTIASLRRFADGVMPHLVD